MRSTLALNLPCTKERNVLKESKTEKPKKAVCALGNEGVKKVILCSNSNWKQF